MYKKEIRNSKALIVFCLFTVAFGAGNFMWGMVSGRPFSIISGLFCAIVCGFCVMRSIKTIEAYVRMEQQAEALIERQKDFMEIMNKIQDAMDCLNKGRMFTQIGEEHASSKLTEEIVKNARIEYSKGNISSRELAKKYNVSRKTMWDALTGKTWKHVSCLPHKAKK